MPIEFSSDFEERPRLWFSAEQNLEGKYFKYYFLSLERDTGRLADNLVIRF